MNTLESRDGFLKLITSLIQEVLLISISQKFYQNKLSQLLLTPKTKNQVKNK